jgi:hypothetical protein
MSDGDCPGNTSRVLRYKLDIYVFIPKIVKKNPYALHVLSNQLTYQNNLKM